MAVESLIFFLIRCGVFHSGWGCDYFKEQGMVKLTLWHPGHKRPCYLWWLCKVSVGYTELEPHIQEFIFLYVSIWCGPWEICRDIRSGEAKQKLSVAHRCCWQSDDSPHCQEAAEDPQLPSLSLDHPSASWTPRPGMCVYLFITPKKSSNFFRVLLSPNSEAARIHVGFDLALWPCNSFLRVLSGPWSFQQTFMLPSWLLVLWTWSSSTNGKDDNPMETIKPAPPIVQRQIPIKTLYQSFSPSLLLNP